MEGGELEYKFRLGEGVATMMGEIRKRQQRSSHISCLVQDMRKVMAAREKGRWVKHQALYKCGGASDVGPQIDDRMEILLGDRIVANGPTSCPSLDSTLSRDKCTYRVDENLCQNKYTFSYGTT